MYMSMLMTGWNTADPVSGELVNVGHDWTTVWVRVRTHARKRVERAGAGKAWDARWRGFGINVGEVTEWERDVARARFTDAAQNGTHRGKGMWRVLGSPMQPKTGLIIPPADLSWCTFSPML